MKGFTDMFKRLPTPWTATREGEVIASNGWKVLGFACGAGIEYGHRDVPEFLATIASDYQNKVAKPDNIWIVETIDHGEIRIYQTMKHSDFSEDDVRGCEEFDCAVLRVWGPFANRADADSAERAIRMEG